MLYRAEKVVASLPGTLEPSTLYFVRSGVGFDLYLSDMDGSTAHPINSGGGSGVSKAIFPIWAEENGALSTNAYEWSWGNGATGTDIGNVVPLDVELFAVTFNADVFGSLVGMQTKANGNIIRLSTFASNNSIDDGFAPVFVARGSRIDFRTGTLIGSTTDARVGAWFREV